MRRELHVAVGRQAVCFDSPRGHTVSDEIAEMAHAHAGEFATFLEESKVRRLDCPAISPSMSVLAATNRPWRKLSRRIGGREVDTTV